MSVTAYLSDDPNDCTFYLRRFLADLKAVASDPTQTRKSFLARGTSTPFLSTPSQSQILTPDHQCFSVN